MTEAAPPPADDLRTAGSTTPPTRPTPVITRRSAVAGAAVVVVAAGGGVTAGMLQSRPRSGPGRADPAHVATLRAALAAERVLLAGLPPAGSGGAVVAQVRADHQAHARALRGLLAAEPGATGSPSASSPAAVPPLPSGDAATLAARENAASVAAARRARMLTGDAAAVVASIAACEATHAALFM